MHFYAHFVIANICHIDIMFVGVPAGRLAVSVYVTWPQWKHISSIP